MVIFLFFKFRDPWLSHHNKVKLYPRFNFFLNVLLLNLPQVCNQNHCFPRGKKKVRFKRSWSTDCTLHPALAGCQQGKHSVPFTLNLGSFPTRACVGRRGSRWMQPSQTQIHSSSAHRKQQPHILTTRTFYLTPCFPSPQSQSVHL